MLVSPRLIVTLVTWPVRLVVRTLFGLRAHAKSRVRRVVILGQTHGRPSRIPAGYARAAVLAMARCPGFDATMSVADLDASMELLYFMWVAAGRAPELVTLENVALIRAHFLNHFAELPPDMQYALANAQKIYAGLRVLWYTGGGPQRATMSRNFNQELNALGLGKYALGFIGPGATREGVVSQLTHVWQFSQSRGCTPLQTPARPPDANSARSFARPACSDLLAPRLA